MKLSQILKTVRRNQNTTLDEIRKKSGLSKGFLSKIENENYDNKNISLETIINLANGLGLKVKDLFDLLNIIEDTEAPSLNTYLRKKYDIKNNNDIAIIEDLIKRLKK